MTLADIQAMDSPTITAEQAGKVLGAAPQLIRMTARTHPEMLGYPVICYGRRVKIPRIPFIEYLTGGAVCSRK